jgi:hypothetical protein
MNTSGSELAKVGPSTGVSASARAYAAGFAEMPPRLE